VHAESTRKHGCSAHLLLEPLLAARRQLLQHTNCCCWLVPQRQAALLRQHRRAHSPVLTSTAVSLLLLLLLLVLVGDCIDIFARHRRCWQHDAAAPADAAGLASSASVHAAGVNGLLIDAHRLLQAQRHLAYAGHAPLVRCAHTAGCCRSRQLAAEDACGAAGGRARYALQRLVLPVLHKLMRLGLQHCASAGAAAVV
jgi:hypothetical protein